MKERRPEADPTAALRDERRSSTGGAFRGERNLPEVRGGSETRDEPALSAHIGSPEGTGAGAEGRRGPRSSARTRADPEGSALSS
jgi:hypothetical protein